MARENISDMGRLHLALAKSHFLVRRSIKFLKNVLLLSRIRETDMDLEPVDLRIHLNRAIDSVRGIFPDRDPSIEFSRPETPFEILAEDLAGEIFFNLLHNAVKVQTDKKPVVSISLDEIGDSIEVRIEDHGPGISDDEKTEIFHRDEANRYKAGTGLGLSICRELVERYGGDIGVRDRVEGDRTMGSCFIVRFPKYTG